MSALNTLADMAKGSLIVVAALTALPVFGAVGALTATGAVIGSVVGAAVVLAEKINDES